MDDCDPSVVMWSTTYQPNDQQRTLQECFPQYRNAAAILKDKKAEATTVRELRALIEREIHLDLTNALFDPQEETLLPKAGACARNSRIASVYLFFDNLL